MSVIGENRKVTSSIQKSSDALGDSEDGMLEDGLWESNTLILM